MLKTQSLDKVTITIKLRYTVSSTTQYIEVNVEVYTAYPRTQWNMNKNDAKHAYNNILFSFEL